MQKGKGLLNIFLLILVIVAIVLVIWAIISLVFNGNTVNLDRMNDKKAKQTVVYDVSLSANNATLKSLKISFQKFQTAVSKLTYEDLKNASVSKEKDKDVFSLANKLIDELHLPIDKVSPKSVKEKTLTNLIYVMNTCAGLKVKGNLKADSDQYVAKFKELLKLTK